MNMVVKSYITVLVVDEKMFIRRTMHNVLCSLGLSHIREAASAAEATTKMDGVDVIFFDTTLPVKDGLEIVRQAAMNEIPPALILMTGGSSIAAQKMQSAAEAKGLDILGVVEKPVTAVATQGMLNKCSSRPAKVGGIPVLSSQFLSSPLRAADFADQPSPHMREATGLHYECAGPERTADICSYLYQICKRCQAELLNARGIMGQFDVTGGKLPLWQCEILGRVVQILLSDICKGPPAKSSNATITVALRHRADIWILAVADSGIRAMERPLQQEKFELAQNIVRPLRGIWRSRPMINGALTTFMFADSDSGENKLTTTTRDIALDLE